MVSNDPFKDDDTHTAVTEVRKHPTSEACFRCTKPVYMYSTAVVYSSGQKTEVRHYCQGCHAAVWGAV